MVKPLLKLLSANAPFLENLEDRSCNDPKIGPSLDNFYFPYSAISID